MNKDFEFLPHTADIKIRVYGTTLQELFKNALIGMFTAVGPKTTACTKKNERFVCDTLDKKHDVEISAGDVNALLVDFLSEALYLSDVHDEAYFDVTVHEIHETLIKATLHGVSVIGFEVVELKAVTYHELDIQNIDCVYQTNIIFDI